MILRSVVFRLALAIVVLAPLTASAQSISASPTTLTVTAAPGAAVPSQNVTLRKSGNGRESWTIGSVASWVRVSPMSGGESATLVVSYVTSSLPSASGPYPLFTITPSKGSPITVSANLTVTT